ncbi:hypothetical protein GCM10010399_54760 [Dactylosporangium fulvum]|uniref:Uncharacterized protein n=1 Tax=Dactylosporangium fulvum TaxID=53359 RepID=A0ABY5WCB7_9ACTN|nr:hypothetical protein [Dactylosporangium fulvum]UWP86684.1 hypothetical protein Dfulv_21575 [Dactylosporangium fulvum]
MTYAVGDVVASFALPRADGGDLTVDPRASAATVVGFTANHRPYALARLGFAGSPTITICGRDLSRVPPATPSAGTS